MRPTTNEDAFIRSAVRALHRAQTRLPQDVVDALESALDAESNARAKQQLSAILRDARLATTKDLPICQDTGIPTFFWK